MFFFTLLIGFAFIDLFYPDSNKTSLGPMTTLRQIYEDDSVNTHTEQFSSSDVTANLLECTNLFQVFAEKTKRRKTAICCRCRP